VTVDMPMPSPTKRMTLRAGSGFGSDLLLALTAALAPAANHSFAVVGTLAGAALPVSLCPPCRSPACALAAQIDSASAEAMKVTCLCLVLSILHPQIIGLIPPQG